MEKLIITDVDGVLLDWETHFHAYMHSQGHTRTYDSEASYWKEDDYRHLGKDQSGKMVYHFNTSAWMLSIPHLRDAQSGVRRLVENGYQFIAVTAMGIDPHAKLAREINLERMFGQGVFREVFATSMSDPNSKVEILKQWRDRGLPWIEDKPSNAEIGATLGYDTFLVDHTYNQDFDTGKYIQRVNSWSDICNSILPSC